MLIILAGLLGMATIMAIEAMLLYLWLPENVDMMIELILTYMENQG